MKTLCFSFLSIALLLTACTAPPPAEEPAVEDTAQKEADRQAQYQLVELWDAANLAGDVAANLELVTDDYIRMEYGTPAMVGKEAFGAFLKSAHEKYQTQRSENTLVEIRLAGDWAAGRGTFKGTVVPKEGGDPIELTGKWMDIRERQPDGSWKVSRTSASTDQPFDF